MSWIVAGSALGPYLFSLGNAWTGSYQAVLYASLLVPGSVLVMSFFADPPQRKETPVPVAVS